MKTELTMSIELEEIANYKDLSDPTCMDKVLLQLERLKAEDEDFMQLLTIKCAHQEITWELPWYQQANSLTRPFKESYENEINTYRKDTICKVENKRIRKNWRKFRKQFDVPDKLICFARWKNHDKSSQRHSPAEHARRFLTAYLARGLERTLYQVYRHVITYFGCPNKKGYSTEELNIMEICFHHCPTKAVTYLSALLGREPRGIYKKLETKYNAKIERKRIKWTIPLATKYLKLIMKYTELPLEKLKNNKIDKSIWLKLETEMNQHYGNLQQFWYTSLHVQLFVESDTKINKLKRKVYKILRDSDYKVWTDIRWKEVLKHFPDGFTRLFLYRICRDICHRYPNYLAAPLQEVVQYGINRAKLKRFANRRLKRLRLNENGDLEYIQYKKCYDE